VVAVISRAGVKKSHLTVFTGIQRFPSQKNATAKSAGKREVFIALSSREEKESKIKNQEEVTQRRPHKKIEVER
jgi:hypothetical protein